GLVTNRDYLVAALRHDRFVHARLGTDWLESAGIEGTPPLPDSRWLALAAALLVERRSRPHGWLAHWSPSGPMERPVELRVADRSFALRLLRAGPGQWRAWAAGARERALLLELPGAGRVGLDGLGQGFDAIVDDSGGHLDAFGYSGAFADDAPRPPRRESAGSGAMSAGMHGLLASVQVEAGDIVDRGDPLFSIEALKMNHRTDAPFRAKVLEVCARPAQPVGPDQVLRRRRPQLLRFAEPQDELRRAAANALPPRDPRHAQHAQADRHRRQRRGRRRRHEHRPGGRHHPRRGVGELPAGLLEDRAGARCR